MKTKSKPTKPITIDVSLENHKVIKEIIRRTGETKVELLNRLIEQENQKPHAGRPINQQGDEKIENAITLLKEILRKINTNEETVASIRDGANKIYSAELFCLKELFRTMHFISGYFFNTSLLQKDKLSIINDNANQDAANTFSNVFKILTDSNAKSILNILSNK